MSNRKLSVENEAEFIFELSTRMERNYKDILFPGQTRPVSAYVDSDLSAELC